MKNGSVIAILLSSGPVVKVVLLVLILFSISCWALIFIKWRKIKAALKRDDEFQEIFWRASGIDELYTLSNHHHSPMSSIFKEAYGEIIRLRDVKVQKRPVKAWLDNLERSIDKAILIEMWQLESSIGWLATIGNASPFIGLFGTVWGIMRSFHEIGLRGSATLATVAPGISEALIATAVGLAAAIPAVIAYNWFTGWLGEVDGNLRCFKNDLMNLMERELTALQKE